MCSDQVKINLFRAHCTSFILLLCGLSLKVPLCPASLKCVVFNKAPPSDKSSLLWLVNWPSALWLAEYHKPHRKCNFSFQKNIKTVNNVLSFTVSSSREGNRVTWQTQWWSSYVFAHKPQLRRFLTRCTLWPSLSLSHTQTHTHTHTHTHTSIQNRQIVIALVFLCGSVVEHCVSWAKGCGFDSQGTHVLIKMYNLNAIVSRFG